MYSVNEKANDYREKNVNSLEENGQCWTPIILHLVTDQKAEEV
jgi:hypothetical protein